MLLLRKYGEAGAKILFSFSVLMIFLTMANFIIDIAFATFYCGVALCGYLSFVWLCLTGIQTTASKRLLAVTLIILCASFFLYNPIDALAFVIERS